MTPCSHGDGLQSFRKTCCLHLQGQSYDIADGSIVFILNVGIQLQGYTLAQTQKTADDTINAVET
jgi:GTP cyclohydrolase II